jgi:addiction module HigA family antidote
MPRSAIHSGKVLAEELETLGVTPTELSRQLAVPPNRISQIINGKRAITGDKALRLAHWFKTRPGFWLNFQNAFDLRKAQENTGSSIARLPTRATAARGHRDARNAPTFS